MPSFKVTLSLDLHFMVVKSGLRADLKARDFRVLFVGDIYSLESVVDLIPPCTTLNSLP